MWQVVYVVFGIVLVYKIYVKLTTGICACTTLLYGKTVLITGANTGIGKVTALDMAKRGARVILACRDMKKANKAKDEIVSKSNNENVSIVKLDLASLTSVRECAREILASEPRLDVLINNAGFTSEKADRTEDDIDKVLQVNHYGPFLFTNLLVDLLKKSSPSRIIFVASINHNIATIDEENFEPKKSLFLGYSYNCCKLYNIMTSNVLAEKLKGTGVTVNSLHPGIIYTEIWSGLPFYFRALVEIILRFVWKTVIEGAQTTIHLAVAPELKRVSGKYFSDCKETIPSSVAQDMDLATRLWEKSKQRVGL